MRKLFSVTATLFVSLFVLTLLVGCDKHHDFYGGRFGDSGDKPVKTNQPPVLISSTPANDAREVSLKTRIVAVFNKEMDPTTFNSTIFQIHLGSTIVDGTVTCSGITAVFTPTKDLDPNANYIAHIHLGAKDAQGVPLDHLEVWTFTTGATPDLTPPTVISTDPGDKATAVSITSALTASFSEAIDPSTITAATFLLKQGTTAVPGKVIGLENRAAFAPDSKLAASTTYSAVITTGVKDLAGNPMAASYSWSFVTGEDADFHPPTVVLVTPAEGATNVLTHTALTVVFSDVMDPATINQSTFLVTQGGIPVEGTISFLSTSATFQPKTPLAPNTLITATITRGAQDPSGHSLAAPFTWTFTTGAAPDTTPPTVISTDPASGAALVAVNSAIVATFSEGMDPSTVSATTCTLSQGTTSVPATVSYSGTLVTITPTAVLANSTPYTVTITTGASDHAGNALAENYVWTFTTVPEAAPPTVLSTSPASGASSVAINSPIVATFSEGMDPSTITAATCLLNQGVTVIPASVTYSGTAVTITPTAVLANATAYSVTITTGAKDLAGNAMAQNYVWSFTTVQETTLPTVISTVPASGATLVEITSTVVATFSEAMAPGTISSSTILLKKGAVVVAGAVTYSGLQATFTPSANLDYSTVYSVTIATSVTDLVGNALASPYVFEFTTKANPFL